ncbi:MAG TPA: hypothetical protein VKI00_08180 [Mycobacterium sp.]|uniref:hypothetical protein n=1 Tax=Mycobacterium sp. TaxID=1785 RepID=UPI002B98C494|nr:hypothetical protein [Mycobacterium sp.]HME75622.1 hypothetical protein [Mycobacterium sp.]
MAKGPKHIADIFVGIMGATFVATTVLGYAYHRPDTPTITFAILGAGLVLAAPLLERLKGEQKFGPTGFELNVGQAEQEVKNGQVVDAREVIPPPERTVISPRVVDDGAKPGPAPIVFTASASREVQALDTGHQERIRRTLEYFRQHPDSPRALEIRDYRILDAGDGIRLIVRPLDKTSEEEPDRYVVLRVLSNEPACCAADLG